MASKKYYWLKLQKDFFKRHDIRIIEEMPNGKDYILFYMKLLVESISHEGHLRFSEAIPYNEEMLSTITHTNIDIVRSAVNIFTELNLMNFLDDGTLYMNETSKMMGVETDWAKKKEDYRRRKALNVTSKDLPDKYPYKLGECTIYNKESIGLPNGEKWTIDEKRYGGNGKLAIANSGGKCSNCGVEKSSRIKLVIHHDNGYSNNIKDLKILCTSCHGKRHGQKEDMSDKSIELEKELELDKEIDNKKPKKETKNKYGEYKHVLLTKTEYNKLITDWNESEVLRMIKDLDEGIELKGYKYKSHNLALRKWKSNETKKETNSKWNSSKGVEFKSKVL